MNKIQMELMQERNDVIIEVKEIDAELSTLRRYKGNTRRDELIILKKEKTNQIVSLKSQLIEEGYDTDSNSKILSDILTELKETNKVLLELSKSVKVVK